MVLGPDKKAQAAAQKKRSEEASDGADAQSSADGSTGSAEAGAEPVESSAD
jgi:hypothetical protein